MCYKSSVCVCTGWWSVNRWNQFGTLVLRVAYGFWVGRCVYYFIVYHDMLVRVASLKKFCLLQQFSL